MNRIRNNKIVGEYPLLLTGTIDANIYNNIGNRITDVNIRLEQYESAIYRYIKESPFNPIVFVENSGYDFDENKFKIYAEEFGKKFEFIKGKICYDEITKKGKSFGDAFLIYEGLIKSKLLSKSEYFYKITGRIFLKNANEIVKTKDKYRNEFICYTGLGWCLTNIFKCNKEDYLRELGDIYLECDETKVRDIEISFYYRLIKANMEIDSFETFPWFDGIQGATLQNYSGGGMERFIRNICAKLHVFKLNSISSKAIMLMMKLKRIKPYEY